jgi:hypothetical protein
MGRVKKGFEGTLICEFIAMYTNVGLDFVESNTMALL